MDKLYFLVSKTDSFQPDQDPIGLLNNYFVTEGGFVMALIIALAIAAAGVAIFYGVFGMKIFKLATRPVYWCMFVLVGVLTFVTTQFVVIGSRNNVTGFFASAETTRYCPPGTEDNYFDRYVEDLGDEDAAEALQQREDLENKMDGFCDVVRTLDLSNALYALIVFFVLSLGVKNLTRHAKRIPF